MLLLCRPSTQEEHIKRGRKNNKRKAPHICLVYLDHSLGPVPLVPIVVDRRRVQRQHDVVRNEVARRQHDAEPRQPRQPEDAVVQCENGELDDAHAPRVDEDVRKCDLPGWVSSNEVVCRVCERCQRDWGMWSKGLRHMNTDGG